MSSRELPDAEKSALTEGREVRATRFLLFLWLTTALFLVGVALVVAIALKTVTIPVYDDPFFAQFCLLKAAFYPPQVAKNSAYLTACLAAPFLLAAGAFFARVLVDAISPLKLRLAFRAANLLNGLFLTWCLFPMVYCPVPAMQAQLPDWLAYSWFFAGEPFFTFPRFVVLVIAAGLCRYFHALPSSSRNRNLAFAVVIATWLLVVLTRFYMPVEIDDEWRFSHHLNPLVFGLSQVAGGHHYPIQFPHRYGGYIEFLGPVVACLPRRVETVLLLFGGLDVIAMACLLGVIRLLVRSPLQVLLAGWSLLGMLTIDSGDPYYQAAVVRGLLPAVGLLLATAYMRRPGPLLYGATSVLAAVAPLWNPDSGIVLWCSWTGMLIVREIGARSFRKIASRVAAQVLLLAGAAATFLCYLRIVSGQWTDPALFFASQKVFIGLGYYCLPILIPDAWMLVVAVYALGLAAASIFYWRGKFSWRTHALLMLSLMGIGSFSYFMGRSAESNLVSSSCLLPVLLGLMLSETRGLIAAGKLPQLSWVLAFPLTFLQAWWALLLVLALPVLAAHSVTKVAAAMQPFSSTPFGVNLAFLRQQIQPRECPYILSDQSGFYHYLTGTVSDLDLPSTDEFVWTKNIDELVTAIDARQIPKLIIDQNFFETKIYNDAIYARLNQAIAQSYRAEATSPDGRLTLYVPR